MRTNKKLSVILGVVLLGTVISLPSYANNLDVALQNEINTYVAKYSAAEGDSAVQVSVLLPGELTPRDYVAGKQMKEASTPATTSMMMQWGSITKEFTSLLLFQYLNKHPGSFSLDSTLFEMLPERFDSDDNAWPDAWKTITIKQLMNMTSGIPDYLDLPTFDMYRITDLSSIVDQAATYQNRRGCQPAIGCFPAGTNWNYSNTDYIILGMMVEKLYGENFAAVIQEQILHAMQQTGNHVVYQTPYTPETLQNMINGYSINQWHFVIAAGENVTNVNLNLAASAGALTGSTHALVNIIHGLFHDQFLPHDPMQQFLNSGWVRTDNHQLIDINSDLAKQVCTKQSPCFGLGFMIAYEPIYGQDWEYEGGTPGFTTDYMWLPQENVVIGISRNGGNGAPSEFAGLRNDVQQIVYQYLHPGKK